MSPTITSARTRRRSLPSSVQYLPATSLSPVQRRPDTVPAGTGRGSENHRTSEPRESPLTASAARDLKIIEREEWVKASWKKGECREEIKLIAEASGLAFDDARIVTLRLYNHFNWLPHLQERSEQLSAMVGRERRLSLSLVRKEILAPAAQDLRGDGPAGSVGNDSCGSAGDGGCAAKGQFSHYVRGLCVVCNEGSFDQILDVLFRAYSRARGGQTITRTEMAVMLAKHVIYEDSEGPTTTKERVYRWLKRQFIDLTASSSLAASLTATAGGRQGCGVAAAATAYLAGSVAVTEARRDQDGGCISWDSARELLRHAPCCLETSLALNLPCLSTDLWTSDLVDVRRTSIASSMQ
ncbi:unnamed protein product [Hapterophycus canaliculatus]